MWRGAVEVALDQHAVVAEGLTSPRAWRRRERGGELLGARRPRACPCRRRRPSALISTGIADARRPRFASSAGVLVVAVIARHQRHAGLLHQRFAAALAPIAAIAAGGGPMKTTPARCAGGGERLVLGQEAVAGMDRLRAGSAARRRGSRRREVALARRAAADAARLVASATCSASRSASEYTATVRMPSRRAVRATRQAISPRLAIRILREHPVSALRFSRKDAMPSLPSAEARISAMLLRGLGDQRVVDRPAGDARGSAP